jgi:hypothetical protein
LAIALVVGMPDASASTREGMQTADAFIDAFYSFEADQLKTLLMPSDEADSVLYYQAWAEAAHYVVQTRKPCRFEDGVYVCEITVTDDFGTALGYTATDTFRLQIQDGKVHGVTFAGDDPPVFNELFEWMQRDRPEVFSGPCKDMFAGGTTPGACAVAVAQAARDFMNR